MIRADSLLAPYEAPLSQRLGRVLERARQAAGNQSLADFASGHEFFGLHRVQGGWVFREWAPQAGSVFLVGDFSGWEERPDLALSRGENGVWEIRLPPDALCHGDLYRLGVHWEDGRGNRVPAYARRVVQDAETSIFNAQVWDPEAPHVWSNPAPETPPASPLIYEAHVGMGQSQGRVGTYAEFTRHVLPRIREAGYNTVQLMAVAEHPYYASFGYQVSSFFACSSRFGTPDELKALVDAAHGMGLWVVMDLVHSHSVSNENEGLARFDGTPFQYFHQGERGRHPAWDSRLFDYSKPQVLHFLLSNCRFWLDEYRFDGFRFDGVTSMLYTHHGLEKVFGGYADYFGPQADLDAWAYLALANAVVREVRPGAVTIAEDVSGMPGLARPLSSGGAGFDYRFAMGVPDYWIQLVKDTPDESWPMGKLWFELTNRRFDEKTISYAEAHDQALVGDQTLIMRMAGEKIYDHMTAHDPDLAIDRAMALHKMIRLATLATAKSGYMNFMGNEFGHPEWIDFPRPGNDWSFHYARRQWELADDPGLKYHYLGRFDRDMVALARQFDLFGRAEPYLLLDDDSAKVLAFMRNQLIFAFNFHPTQSLSHFRLPAPPGVFRVALDTDAPAYGGHGRQDANLSHYSLEDEIHRHYLSLYLPARTALVLRAKQEAAG